MAAAERDRELDIKILDAQLARIFDSFKTNQDVFVQLVCKYADGSQVVVGCTEICKNGNLNPRWSQRFLCSRASGQCRTLMLQMHINHSWRNPVLCGEAEFGVDNLWSRAAGGPQRVPVPLFKKGEQTGVLNIQIALQGSGQTPMGATTSSGSANFGMSGSGRMVQGPVVAAPPAAPGPRLVYAGGPAGGAASGACAGPAVAAPGGGAAAVPVAVGSRGAVPYVGSGSLGGIPFYPSGPVQQVLGASGYHAQQQGQPVALAGQAGQPVAPAGPAGARGPGAAAAAPQRPSGPPPGGPPFVQQQQQQLQPSLGGAAPPAAAAATAPAAAVPPQLRVSAAAGAAPAVPAAGQSGQWWNSFIDRG